MGNLFITKHGLKITKQQSCIKIKGEEVDLSVPIGSFSNLFILSNVKITTKLIKYLSSKGKFVFIIQPNGKLQSIIAPEVLKPSFKLRKLQYERFEDEKFRVKLSKELLMKKISLVQGSLKAFYKAYSGLPVEVKLRKHFLRSFAEGAKNMLHKSNTLNQLMGVDGYIMKALYNEFSTSIKDFFKFDKRSYHPPEDEANTILSIVYTVFYSLMIPTIISKGLDPYCGFFHSNRDGHATLASDLMELVRPSVVFFVADMVNKGYFDRSDFKKIKGGVYMKPKSLRVLLKLLCEKLEFSEVMKPAEEFLNYVKNLIQGKRVGMAGSV